MCILKRKTGRSSVLQPFRGYIHRLQRAKKVSNIVALPPELFSGPLKKRRMGKRAHLEFLETHQSLHAEGSGVSKTQSMVGLVRFLALPFTTRNKERF